jgi:hypothetical protein
VANVAFVLGIDPARIKIANVMLEAQTGDASGCPSAVVRISSRDYNLRLIRGPVLTNDGRQHENNLQTSWYLSWYGNHILSSWAWQV